jgi:cytosine/adenosine deaminase-related metal-dependent hydrolase
MPGLVNVHTHLEFPSLLESIRALTFPGWISNLIRSKRNLNEGQYASASRQNIKTLLQTGTTAIGEICTHGVSSSLLKQSGLRGFVFDEIIKMGPKDSKFKVSSPKWLCSHLFHPGLSPHSPFTVSESLFRDISSLNRNKHFRLSMHVAESKDEIRLLQRKKSGLEKLYQFAHWNIDWAPRSTSSFEYLDRIGFLSPDLLAVHAVQVNAKDIDLIKKHRVSIAHCPRSNKELGVGRMPLKKMLDAGITVGLGTDSLASVPTLNMWDEMRYSYKIHKKDGVTAEDIFKIATVGGAKALGLDKEIGTLEAGKKADIIAVPLPKKNTGDLYSDLLRETKSCIMTMVNGKILYQK